MIFSSRKRLRTNALYVFFLLKVCLNAWPNPVWAGSMDWVDQEITEFNENPSKYADEHRHVRKYHPGTGAPLHIESPFPNETFFPESKPGVPNPRFRDFIFSKDSAQKSARKNREQKEHRGRMGIQNNDFASNLVDHLQFTQISQMDNFRSAQVEISPWSDDYWPIYKGSIAARYGETQYLEIAADKEWTKIAHYLEHAAVSNLDDLSPAEKYDLIVGDVNGNKNDLDGPGWSLTKAMLKEGRSYWSPDQPVETWMGICHGWTPASIQVPRPSKALSTQTSDGRKITLYPSDIKALASLLWAKGKFSQKFIGGRCDKKEVATDPKNGKILDSDCFDTNPGTWHQVVVNQIGLTKKSFILDATWDYEVWNQPAFGYEYTYFNPISKIRTEHWRDGLLRLPQSADLFARYRSPRAAYIIGVAMKFIYIAETQPSHRTPDGPSFDRKIAVNYLYDLELDLQLNIIGGEWYHHEHPDFLWRPTTQASAISTGDALLNNHDWDGHHSIPSSWKEPARNSSRSSQPLAAIVNTLVGRSVTE